MNIKVTSTTMIPEEKLEEFTRKLTALTEQYSTLTIISQKQSPVNGVLLNEQKKGIISCPPNLLENPYLRNE